MVAWVAVSANFDAAICNARGRPTQTAVIPAGVEGIALAPLPVGVLDLRRSMRRFLRCGGFARWVRWRSCRRKSWCARLGQEGKRLRQLARGELPHLFVPMEAEFRLEERMELDAPVELLESLLFVVGVMLEQLVLRATARVLALASVTVELKLEGGGTHVRTVRPALPSNERAMWLKLIHLDLEAHPPGAAVVGIVLTAEPGSDEQGAAGAVLAATAGADAAGCDAGADQGDCGRGVCGAGRCWRIRIGRMDFGWNGFSVAAGAGKCLCVGGIAGCDAAAAAGGEGFGDAEGEAASGVCVSRTAV